MDQTPNPKTVLIVLPSTDFDPTEAAVPWQEMTRAGWKVIFATPDGEPAQGDARMLSGANLGIWRALLRAGRGARDAYKAMSTSEAFNAPLSYDDVKEDQLSGILYPGGHAAGIKVYLESTRLQEITRRVFELEIPIGAICHGVVALARSQTAAGKSVLWGRKTTALTAQQEMTAWWMTRLWLGDYYRTYPQSVEEEVTKALEHKSDFQRGPTPILKDDPKHLNRGFVVRDRNYLSARWPGDIHRFSATFIEMLTHG